MKLAIDAVMTLLEGKCDVAILATCDTDLNPVIDALLGLKRLQRSRADVEVIAWKGRQQNLGRPPNVSFRWIGDRDYRAIQDLTDYNRPWPRNSVSEGSGPVAEGGLDGTYERTLQVVRDLD